MTMTRKHIIETAAGLLFGRDADGEPEKGWRAKLARSLGVGNSTITGTLDKASSPVFDRKLYAALSERRQELHKDLVVLVELMQRIDPEAEVTRVVTSFAFDPQETLSPTNWWLVVELGDGGIEAELTCDRMNGAVAIADGDGYWVDGEKLTLMELVRSYRPEDLPGTVT